MHYRNQRLRMDTSRLRATKAKLQLESLESRQMMSADGLPGAVALDRILVSYRDEGPAIVHQVRTPAGVSMERALLAQKAHPNVLFAERDFRVHATAIPNDPYFGYEWGLNNTGQSGGTVDADIDAAEAWDVKLSGPRPTIAVIDSGIAYAHPDLYRNVWINQGEIPSTIRSKLIDIDSDSLITFRDLNDSRNQGQDKITDVNSNGYIDGGDLLRAYASNGYGGWADATSNDGDTYVDDLIGWNFVTNTNNPFDDNGHGTHVAGTIGATTNNGIGVAGVVRESLLVGLKFLDAGGGGYISDAMNAVNYAVAKGIDLSNNSWGGGDYSQAFYDALNNARAHGHIFVAAAGNGGADGVGDDNDAASSYPSSYNLDNVVAVAATDRQDRLASFSNYGATSVDLAAPGANIFSTLPGGYGYASGTSMASPHVTGVLALAQAQNPTASYSQIISRVVNNADAVSSLVGKVATGSRLNAHRALTTVSLDSAGPRIVSAVANAAGAKPVSSVRVTFSEAVDIASFSVADITGFAGPNGPIAPSGVVAVSGSGGTRFDVTFGTQSTPGTYRFKAGPAVFDTAGNWMDQDQDGVLGETSDDRFAVQFAINSLATFSSSPNAAIKDGYATVVSIKVDRDITIADLNVKLDIAHTYDRDLRIYVIAPDGTDVLLVYHRGGSGDNFKSSVLNDEASTTIASGRAPFSGSFRPEYSLSAFDGKNARGTWKLHVEDWYRYNTGKIKSWSLTFEGGTIASSQSLTSGPQKPTPKSNLLAAAAYIGLQSSSSLPAPSRSPDATTSPSWLAASYQVLQDSPPLSARKRSEIAINSDAKSLTDKASNGYRIRLLSERRLWID